MVYNVCQGGDNVKQEMVRKNTRISKEQDEWLTAMSEKKGVPVSHLMMMAIEEFMTNESRRIREREVNSN